jgi:hypothetical protein
MLLIFLVCPSLMAQNSITADINRRVDAISEPVRDIEARYWADMVKKDSSLSIEQLEKNSGSWLGSEKSKKNLLLLIKKYIKSGKEILISKEELARLDESKEKIIKFLNSPEGNIKKIRNEKIDEITYPVRDIKARQLALNIMAKQTTLQELKKNYKGWPGSDRANMALISLTEKYLNSGKPVTITGDEWDLLDENSIQVHTFLNDGKETDSDRKKRAENKKIRKIRESVFETEAQYWANRISENGDITLEQFSLNSLSWQGENSFNQKLVNRTAENIKDGNTGKPDEKALKKLFRAKEKIQKLISAGLKNNNSKKQRYTVPFHSP